MEEPERMKQRHSRTEFGEGKGGSQCSNVARPIRVIYVMRKDSIRTFESSYL